MESLTREAHCTNCGYDLFGGPIAGRCPECGTPFDRRTGLGIITQQGISQERGDQIVTWVKVGVVGVLALAALAGGLVAGSQSADWSRPVTIGGGVALALFAVAGLIYWNDALDRRKR